MENNHQDWSRRNFIASVTAAGAAIMFNPFVSWASNEYNPRIAAIVAKTIGVDTHNHIDVPLNGEELSGSKIDLYGELKKSGLSAICMTFAVDYQQLINPGDAYKRFINGLDAMDNVLKSNNMKRSLNFKDLQFAHKKKIPTVIQSVEGGHFLEGKLERLEEAYSRGLRHLGLLHDNDASVPLGDIFTKPAQWGGLTSLGSDVIKECNKLGILVDLAHCTNETVNAALKVTTKPVLISHTGLDTQLGQNPKMAQMMLPRLISKEQAKIVASSGGVIGVWTHLADTPLEYAQNVRALVDVIGVDHVCIGTDTKMTPPYRSADNKKNNGQRDNNGPKKQNATPKGTNETWQNQNGGFLYTVVDSMLKVGFNEDEIVKIGGGNFCRIFDSATAVSK
ncbi:MAG TPA: membrane dipeptidase [Flavobacterium sp.]|uniref:dipeptidase n=1 Tax=Flavobacterium sp. TaxID=239 RepID=UPI002DB918AA|nr:membrane dipeptidase [Flavobacterium sp.]HEU4788416.1 membrane dipeptidase [Flavobacterium sp.]